MMSLACVPAPQVANQAGQSCRERQRRRSSTDKVEGVLDPGRVAFDSS